MRLVVNADDFGMTPAISRGVVQAHRAGIVTSTSLLGNCADLPSASGLLGETPALGVGVHLALIGGRPVAPAAAIPSLLDGTGAFLPRASNFFTQWIRGQVKASEIETEFCAQIDRVRAAGIVPDHLDTHHHLGFLPVVGKAMEAAARRYGIAGLRSLYEKPSLSWVAEPKRGLEAGLLSGLGWLTRRQMGMLRHGPQSWGFVESGQLDEVRILEIIGRLTAGAHELICHPADQDVPELDGGERRYQRVQELAALTSGRVRAAIEQRGITLCRWSDLT